MMFLIPLLFILLFCTINVSAQTGHWEKLNPPNNPGFRSSHGMAPIGHKKVLLFGGYNGYELNDTWIFDLEKNDWQKVDCKNPPPIREGFGMCQISESQVLIFGGAGNSPLPTYNDLWLFDLDSMDWRELNPRGWQNKYFPLPTYRMGMAKLTENSIVIYGGQINDTSKPTTDYSADTWIYYIDANRWEWRNIGWPGARSDHMMTGIDSNLVLMCGGNKFGFFNDNWYYLLDNFYWFELKDLFNTIPLITASAISNLNRGIAVLFGGETYTIETEKTWYDSTWIFNYYQKTWTKLEINPHPSDRLRGRMARIDSNKALLFGGASQTNRKPEDTWLFTLDPVDVKEEEKSNEIEVIQTNNYLIIKNIDVSGGELYIYDIMGRAISNYSSFEFTRSDEIRIPISHLNSGIYIVKIHNMIEKFIIIK